MSSDNNIYFECECHSDEHMLKFKFFPDDEDPMLYASVYLRHWQPWYKRVWVAIKYVFGYKSKYGDFDCFSMNKEDANKFYNLAKKYKEICG